MKIPIILTFLLLIIGIIAHLAIVKCSIVNNNQISNVIQVWACIAAFISATFVIYSYWITNQSFYLSQKPRLKLAIVDTYPIDEKTKEKVHYTRINYANVSDNAFEDLTIKINFIYNNTTFSLVLFDEKMYMAPRDVRDRYFSTKKDLKEKYAFSLEEAEKTGKEILITTEYEYTFCGKKEVVKMQKYIWETNKQRWAIKYPNKNL
ncbi:MAG: hypothetical protein KAR05_06640 [Candidatus Omnitrophica bacterium]|nr:hypothetical protein [Candidatus Omnitrophota bacterium]